MAARRHLKGIHAQLDEPALIVLDEPTASLRPDPQAEADVGFQAQWYGEGEACGILAMSGERTTIVVSHRLGRFGPLRYRCDRIRAGSPPKRPGPPELENGTHVLANC